MDMFLKHARRIALASVALALPSCGDDSAGTTGASGQPTTSGRPTTTSAGSSSDSDVSATDTSGSGSDSGTSATSTSAGPEVTSADATSSSGETASTDVDTTSVDTTGVDTTGSGGTTDDTTGPIELTCDGSPEWTDPFGDGSLRRAGVETYGLDPSTHAFSFVCASDDARLNVCEESTILELTGAEVTVIDGQGIGPLAGQSIAVIVNADNAAEIHMRVDVSQAPVTLSFNTPQSHVYIDGYGANELGYGGNVGSLTLNHSGDLVLNGIIANIGDVCVGCPVPAPPPCP